MSTARSEGDVHSHNIIIADTMKLLGNSGYGNTITNVDRHRDVNYCTEKAASLMVNDKRFRQLDIVVDDANEIEMNKKIVKYTLPVHVGFFVLQLANMRMLQFYYDFINIYVERPLFQYCEMDTDSAYLALAGESVDDLVTPALRDHYFRHRSEWLPSECCDEHRNEYVRCRLADRPWIGDEACFKARRAFDNRTPGLFKVEWSGDGFVGLCSKTYYCFGATDKYSTNGLSKRHNTIDKDAFLDVLTTRRSGSGKNRGFRVHKSTVLTYVQERAALTYFYAKRCTCFIHDHGCTMETSLHVHRRRTDGVRQEYFRDVYVASRCCNDRSTSRKNHVVLRRMARGLRNDGLGPCAIRGRVTDGGHIRIDNEEPHRHRRSHGRNGRTSQDLVH